MSDNLPIANDDSTCRRGEELIKEGDYQSLLPTDDQLDRFVDNLCDNFPNLLLEPRTDSATGVGCWEFDSSLSSAKPFSYQSGLIPVCAEILNRGDGVEIRDSVSPPQSSDQSKIISNHKKSAPNSNLNVAIIQCTRSLELLIERRKNLESLVRRHHNVTNISYNVSYVPRLPDAPTRVDRLLYDINQERCRIVGLVGAIEKTINSFSSKTAKEDLRKLLVSYGKAIVDVIKERQNEINSLNGSGIIESGVHRLVELIDEVHHMNRHVHTALWCIEVKEQFNVVMLRRRSAESSQSALERKPCERVVSQKSWPAAKLMQQNQSPRLSRTSYSVFRSTACPSKTTQQQTNSCQTFSPPIRPKKSIAFQLFAQQQRAEIFQRFSSTLKQSS